MNNTTAPTTFQPIDVDNIYESTYSAYWSFLTPSRSTGGLVTEFEVEDIESNETFTVGADSLAKAAFEIASGDHTGIHLSYQCYRDLLEWKDNPQYGVPFDAELSDCIIQVAALGEVLYG